MSIREVKRTNGWSMVRIPQELHEKIQRMNFEKKSMTLFTIEVIEEGLKTKINRIRNPIRYSLRNASE